MRGLSTVFLRLAIVCLIAVTLFESSATAATQAGSSRQVRKGSIARILDYVFPDISLPPG